MRRQFTSKERDESGLDFFVARYHSSIQGRFTSVDPALESYDPANPQSLNRYTYCLNQPLPYVDPDGEVPLIGNLIGAGTSVAAGYLIAKLSGQEYRLEDAALDAATGFVGVGLLSKLRQASRIAKLTKMANKLGMDEVNTQVGAVKYVGENKLRLIIKEVDNFKNPATGEIIRHQHSWIPRAQFRVSAGMYLDPFTGAVGPLRSAAGHIPLHLLPLTEAPLVGAVIGGASSTVRGVINWATDGGGMYSQANGAFYNLRVVGLGAARVPTLVAGNLGTVDVYPDGRQRYRGPLTPR